MPNTPATTFNNNTLLAILALSKDATAIYSDVDLKIFFANDSMIALWGKDQTVVNKRLIDAVPELEGQPFLQMLQQVWHTGKTIADRDIEESLEVDGKLQSFYFDFEYRALVIDQGHEDLLDFDLKIFFLRLGHRQMFDLVVDDAGNRVTPLAYREKSVNDIVEIGVIRFEHFLPFGKGV